MIATCTASVKLGLDDCYPDLKPLRRGRQSPVKARFVALGLVKLPSATLILRHRCYHEPSGCICAVIYILVLW